MLIPGAKAEITIKALVDNKTAQVVGGGVLLLFSLLLLLLFVLGRIKCGFSCVLGLGGMNGLLCHELQHA